MAEQHNDTQVDEEFAFNPLDMERTKDWELMRKIRAEKPVVRPAPGIVFTSLLEDTGKVFRDAKKYSSVGDIRAPGVVVPDEESFLGEIDAPLHPKIRRILLKGFTLARSNDAEEWTRGNVRRRIEAFKAQGGGDFMTALAIPLPGSVAAHELGIPDDMHDQVMDWCNELLHSTWPSLGETEKGVGIENAFPEFAAYLDEQIRLRQENESEDLLSLMVNTRDADGWHIDPVHVRTLSANILAGSLSASYMIGNLLYRYLTDEENFTSVLRADRSMIPGAVEESLRFEAPVTFLFRTAKQDGEINGCPIHTGDHIMMGIAAAGRDEKAYPDANEFKMDRVQEPEHLAFGAGPHLCLGNHLTRMVGKVILEEMFEIFRPGQVTLKPEWEWECVAHIQEYGPETLEVDIAP